MCVLGEVMKQSVDFKIVKDYEAQSVILSTWVQALLTHIFYKQVLFYFIFCRSGRLPKMLKEIGGGSLRETVTES